MFLLLAAPLAVGLSACSDDNDDEDPFDEEEWSEAQWARIAKYANMSSLIRPLAGLDALPEDWEIAVYEPGIGVVTDESMPEVRSVLKADVASAELFFLSIVPKDGLTKTSDGYTWTGEGIGSVTFRKVNTADCYATLDVKLQQMPSLAQVRFVPESAIGTNATFSGESFYKAGDVVEDKNGLTWICVRPSSGPEKKEYAYFVTFDLDKSALKTNTEKLYYVNQKNKKIQVTNVSGTWTYGKNLVEKRIAVAAALTFSHCDLSGLGWTDDLFYKSMDIPGVRFTGCYVAHDTYVKTDGEHSSKYIQPMLLANAFSSTSLACFSKRQDSEKAVLSLTDSYDPAYWADKLWTVSQKTSTSWHKEDEAYDEPYDIRRYVTRFEPASRRLTLPAFAYLNVPDSYYNGMIKHPVFVMQQKRVKDRGKAYSGFTLIPSGTPNTFDFWQWLERGSVTLDGDSYSMN